MNDLKIAEQCIPKECKDDLVSRRQVYCLKLASESDLEFGRVLIDMPSAESERKKGKWVPCDERLPEKYGWYICTIKGGNVSSKYWTGKKWIDNVRKHMFELYNIFSKLTGKKITPNEEDIDWDGYVIAWMPLPEPYQSESEESE